MEKGINDLPVDIWLLIFRDLSITDLFNCRLVNKKFKNFSDFTDGIIKLIIGEPGSSGDDYYWYYNNKSIEDKDAISLRCFRSIIKLSIFNLYKYLKYLKIYDQQFKLEEILNLINLESIEFGYYCYENQQKLNLNNLKVFISNNCSVQLNTPKLEKIQFYKLNQIKLNSNPESIKHLITIDYDNELEIFKNLEIIELRHISFPIDENLLIVFKNLRQLKIYSYYSKEIIKNCLIKTLNDKIKLKRVIDIYLKGIKIENIDKFNELISTKDSSWKFRLNNYDLLELNLSSINYLRYDQLEECVNNIKNDLPSFFDKFFHISQIEVLIVNDNDGLNWFLNKLKYLNRLSIYVSLDEIFYNNLPNTIRFLTIHNRKDINHDFILKLSKLISFSTFVDKDLFDLVLESFLNLKYLNTFRFYYKKELINIQKKGSKFYLNNKTIDYNELVDECNEIRLK